MKATVYINNERFEQFENLNLFWLGHRNYPITVTGITPQEAKENMLSKISDIKNGIQHIDYPVGRLGRLMREWIYGFNTETGD